MGYRITRDDVTVIVDKASEFAVALDLFAGVGISRETAAAIARSETGYDSE